MIDEPAIRALVTRLARPTASGAHTIERAAMLAEGPDCAEIEAWIVREGGEPHVAAAAPRGRGLHADRESGRSSSAGTAPSHYVLPAGLLG
jgi:hypothetical protein